MYYLILVAALSAIIVFQAVREVIMQKEYSQLWTELNNKVDRHNLRRSHISASSSRYDNYDVATGEGLSKVRTELFTLARALGFEQIPYRSLPSTWVKVPKKRKK